MNPETSKPLIINITKSSDDVYQAVIGWDTITNAADGTLGSNVENRPDFEYRRKNSVALNGHGTPQSIYAAVFALADVLDVYVIDNPLDSIVNTGATAYPLAKHSVYVAVVGGADADIARAAKLTRDGRNVIGVRRLVLQFDVLDARIVARENFRHRVREIRHVAGADVTFHDRSHLVCVLRVLRKETNHRR